MFPTFHGRRRLRVNLSLLVSMFGWIGANFGETLHINSVCHNWQYFSFELSWTLHSVYWNCSFFLFCINLNWKWDQKCTDQQKIFFQVTRQICRSPTLPFQDCIGSGHSGEESTSLTFQSRDRDGCSKRWRWTRRGLRNLGWDRTKGHFSGYQLPPTCPLLQVPPGQQKNLKHFFDHIMLKKKHLA